MIFNILVIQHFDSICLSFCLSVCGDHEIEVIKISSLQKEKYGALHLDIFKPELESVC